MRAETLLTIGLWWTKASNNKWWSLKSGQCPATLNRRPTSKNKRKLSLNRKSIVWCLSSHRAIECKCLKRIWSCKKSSLGLMLVPPIVRFHPFLIGKESSLRVSHQNNKSQTDYTLKGNLKSSSNKMLNSPSCSSIHWAAKRRRWSRTTVRETVCRTHRA